MELKMLNGILIYRVQNNNDYDLTNFEIKTQDVIHTIIRMVRKKAEMMKYIWNSIKVVQHISLLTGTFIYPQCTDENCILPEVGAD